MYEAFSRPDPEAVGRPEKSFLTQIGSFLGRRPALSLFVFALGLRLISVSRLYASSYGVPDTGDMKFYYDWAMRIASGHLFDSHAFYGQPLYAYLLGGLFRLVGFQPALVSIVQAILDAVTAVLIFKIALLTFEKSPRQARWIGIIAAFGWVFFVPAVAYCGLLISVSWIVTAWWFCVWWLLQRRTCAPQSEWFFISLFIGVIAMMSAAILFLLPLVVAGALISRYPAKTVVIAVAGVLFGTAPCWICNAVVAQDPVFLSAHSGINFWIGNNPEANGYPKVPHGLPSDSDALLRQSIASAESAEGHPLQRSAVSAFWSIKARNFISTHLWSWLGLLCIKTKNFWNNFEYDDLSSITALRDAAITPPGLHFGFIAVLGLPGCILAMRVARARWVVAAVLLQMVALLPVFVNERYRLPAAPGLLLLTAFILSECTMALAEKNWRFAALALGLIAFCSWFVTLPPTDPALWSLDDYKAAKREIAAGDYVDAEYHLHRALATMVPPPQVAPAMARTFADAAHEKLRSGDRVAARVATDRALSLQPNDESLRVFRHLLDQQP
jgi:hypothetical protein